MSKEKILKQILKRLDRLEKTVFGIASNVKSYAKKISKTCIKVSLPALILPLREQGFFKQPKTPEEVHKRLQSIYPCDLNRVEVALLRLHKKRQLRRISKVVKDKKIIAYVW